MTAITEEATSDKLCATPARGRSVVAIVGRPNVGKSTLFNRITGRRLAIVEEAPGTTRDRISADVSWGGCEFTLVDTGGLEIESGTGIKRMVGEQAEMAIEEADSVLFLVDAKEGITSSDWDIADVLRRSGKRVILAVNKVDNARLEDEVPQFYQLGFAELLSLSAYHNLGMEQLLNEVAAHLPSLCSTSPRQETARIAIVGRPNAGKSMLLNAILGEERVIVNETPGTTRDAVDTVFEYGGGESMVLIDTAGIRRRGKVERGIEQYSVMRAMGAVDRADVALLLIDATEPLIAQDLHIAGYVHKAYKGIIVAINKWDLVEEGDPARWAKRVRRELKFVPYAPVLFTSARTRYGASKVIPMARAVCEERCKRIPTPKLNRAVMEAAAAHLPPAKGGSQLNILYATQTGINPPTFVFFVNDARLVHFSYRRYLENKLRAAFGFEGTPLHLIFKRRRGR